MCFEVVKASITTKIISASIVFLDAQHYHRTTPGMTLLARIALANFQSRSRPRRSRQRCRNSLIQQPKLSIATGVLTASPDAALRSANRALPD
jgi:hypothetical protein